MGAAPLLVLFVILFHHKTTFSHEEIALKDTTFWKEFTTAHAPAEQQKLFAEARDLIMTNIQQEESRSGILLDTFVVNTQSNCALACGLREDCHFIDIKQRGGTPGVDYTCELYSESTGLVGSSVVVGGDCSDSANDIKDFINVEDVQKKFETFL